MQRRETWQPIRHGFSATGFAAPRNACAADFTANDQSGNRRSAQTEDMLEI